MKKRNTFEAARFYEALSWMVKRKWKACFWGGRKNIRLFRRADSSICFCPITAVCLAEKNKEYLTTSVAEAAVQLRLNPAFASQIVKAADNVVDGEKRVIPTGVRSKLLHALNLKEAV